MIGKESNTNISIRHYDDRLFPDSLRCLFKTLYAKFRKQYPCKKITQKELVFQLKAFNKMAHNKPLFFADIHQVYNDDFDAYVKYMFKNSILIYWCPLKEWCGFILHCKSVNNDTFME